MGISGLHPVLKPYLSQVHISKYKGQRIACDAYAWLHRGAVGCAAELAEGSRPWAARGYPAPYVEYCLRMVATLRRSGAIPVLVLDGGRLPAKAQTNLQRRERKQAVLERARELLARGQAEEARSLLSQTVDVTCVMAAELIAALRQQGVEFLVAPYEADAQLAFLASLPQECGGVGAVITEDSDLVAYGTRALLFKFDSAGYAQELCIDDLFRGPPPQQPLGEAVMSFAGWDLAMLQGACVLAGCDFLASVKGVGFKTAHKLIKSRRTLGKALNWMRLEKKYQVAVTREYVEAALRAVYNFRHPLVFDANQAGWGGLVRLTPLPAELEGGDLDYLGPPFPDHIARGIAYGHLHPRTHEPYAGAPPPPYSTPSIATRQRLASWMTPAARAQPGLGPRQAIAAGRRASDLGGMGSQRWGSAAGHPPTVPAGHCSPSQHRQQPRQQQGGPCGFGLGSGSAAATQSSARLGQQAAALGREAAINPPLGPSIGGIDDVLRLLQPHSVLSGQGAGAAQDGTAAHEPPSMPVPPGAHCAPPLASSVFSHRQGQSAAVEPPQHRAGGRGSCAEGGGEVWDAGAGGRSPSRQQEPCATPSAGPSLQPPSQAGKDGLAQQRPTASPAAVEVHPENHWLGQPSSSSDRTAVGLLSSTQPSFAGAERSSIQGAAGPGHLAVPQSRAPIPSKRRSGGALLGTGGKGSGSKKKKGAADASQTRISQFFNAAPQ